VNDGCKLLHRIDPSEVAFGQKGPLLASQSPLLRKMSDIVQGIIGIFFTKHETTSSALGH
jgi:hypothetical protein